MKNRGFELHQIRPEGGDCTAPYSVILKKEYTVQEFVRDVVSRDDEWGFIHIGESIFSKPSCEYRWGKLLSKLPEEVQDKKIVSATAHGGWSSMDYFLKLED